MNYETFRIPCLSCITFPRKFFWHPFCLFNVFGQEAVGFGTKPKSMAGEPGSMCLPKLFLACLILWFPGPHQCSNHFQVFGLWTCTNSQTFKSPGKTTQESCCIILTNGPVLKPLYSFNRSNLSDLQSDSVGRTLWKRSCSSQEASSSLQWTCTRWVAPSRRGKVRFECQNEGNLSSLCCFKKSPSEWPWQQIKKTFRHYAPRPIFLHLLQTFFG